MELAHTLTELLGARWLRAALLNLAWPPPGQIIFAPVVSYSLAVCPGLVHTATGKSSKRGNGNVRAFSMPSLRGGPVLASYAFCCPKEVSGPAQTQGRGNGLVLQMGSPRRCRRCSNRQKNWGHVGNLFHLRKRHSVRKDLKITERERGVWEIPRGLVRHGHKTKRLSGNGKVFRRSDHKGLQTSKIKRFFSERISPYRLSIR